MIISSFSCCGIVRVTPSVLRMLLSLLSPFLCSFYHVMSGDVTGNRPTGAAAAAAAECAPREFWYSVRIVMLQWQRVVARSWAVTLWYFLPKKNITNTKRTTELGKDWYTYLLVPCFQVFLGVAHGQDNEEIVLNIHYDLSLIPLQLQGKPELQTCRQTAWSYPPTSLRAFLMLPGLPNYQVQTL
jgi:hypothetical protein